MTHDAASAQTTDSPAAAAPPSAQQAPAQTDAPGLAPAASPLDPEGSQGSRRWLLAVGFISVAALAGSGLVWQKFNAIQEQLARQSADANGQAAQASATAKQSQDLALETAAKLAVLEARLAEVSLQRSQLEELMQSLSRSRDENLVVDIESSLRLAQQQAQLTGSLEPLSAALKSAEQRITRAAQPRLAQVQRALARDVARIKGTALADTPSLLVKLDELVNQVDDLPVANSVGQNRGAEPAKPKADAASSAWWWAWWNTVHQELRTLVRVSRVENPDAALLSPEQAFFLRENLKLKILNARLGLLSRQVDSARSDLATASASLGRFFDGSSRKTQNAAALLQQVQSQMKLLDIPRIDESLTALSTAAAGR